MVNRTMVNRTIIQEKEKQVRFREKHVLESVSYVDSARNIAVVLEAKDLSEDLESEKLGFKVDPTAPSTKVRPGLSSLTVYPVEMFHKVAKYYEKKKQFVLASSSLESAEALQTSRRRDWSVAVTKAEVSLSLGQYSKALKLADAVVSAHTGPDRHHLLR